MGKSNYPEKLDTSAEIPPVRDNVLEVGSDVINSLRSAIFNIERVLGINPQGAVGYTVAERISRALDGNGNIKKDALTSANVLSGPIIDSDVSKVAAIAESKLKLNFPTTLLQSEISTINSEMALLIEQTEALSVTISAHVNASAINRHPSTAISVSAHTVTSTDVALSDLSSGTVQSTFEDIIDSHLGYSGADISLTNNSHVSEQVFFDNSDVSDIIPSENVQGAMEDLAGIALSSQISHRNLQHSNGILRVGNVDSATTSGVGNVLSSDVTISFSKTIGLSSGISTVTVGGTIAIGDFKLEKSDILTITDTSDADLIFSGSYEIESFTNVGGNVTVINVYGIFISDSTSLTLGRVSKNIQVGTNHVGLLSSVREEATLTSAKSVQICNPNSVKVISSGIRPMEITLTNRFINVTADSGTTTSIDLFNGDVSYQSIDSIVSRVNEQCAESSLNIFSYRVDYETGRSELAIAHNIPDSAGDLHTISIGRDSDSGIDAGGFADIEDLVISSEFGSDYYINGVSYNGLSSKLDSTSLSFSATAIVVGSSSSGVDFLDLGIKSQDILIISDSATASDDGSYIIENVTSTQITLGAGQLPSGFTGVSQDETRFRVWSNTASFESILFSEVSSSFGSVLADVFLSSKRSAEIDKRFEYSAELLGTESLIVLVDFEGEVSDEEFVLEISPGTNVVSMSLDSGKSLEVRGDNSYVWVESGTRNVRLKLMVLSVSSLNTLMSSTASDVVMSFFGFKGVNEDSNLLISRVAFNNFSGRISGGEETARTFPILQRGNVGLNEFSSKAINRLIERPIDELRSSGVVRNLEITGAVLTSDLFTFNVNSGTCYVNGRRIEISEQTTFISHIDATAIDKIFIVVNEDGVIKVDGATPDCKSPFEPGRYCTLSSIEYDGTNLLNIDLRLFIDSLDFKLLNSITVSPQQSMGHFSEFGKAVKYAKRFSQLFPDAGTPTVHLKSGTHTINTAFDSSAITFADWQALPSSTVLTQLHDGLALAGLVIDFPVNITGEGDSSVLRLRNVYTFSDAIYSFRGIISMLGGGYTSHTIPIDKFTSGFTTYRDFRMDNCRIELIDFNLDDGSDEYIFGMSIENITIDLRGFKPNPFDTSIGPIAIGINESDDTSSNKGNVSVRNCDLIIDSAETNVSIITVPSPSRAKNLLFVGNRLMGAVSSSEVSLFSQDIWTFTSSDAGSNIEISGNTATSSFDASSLTRPKLVPGLSAWGDRIGQTLRIGSDLIVGDDLTVTDNASVGGDFIVVGSVSGSSYNYNSSVTAQKFVFMDQISDPAMGSQSANAASFASESIDGASWKTIEFSDSGVGTEFARLRLDVKNGETLTGLGIFFSSIASGSSSFGGFSLIVYAHDAYGIQTTVSSLGGGAPSTSGDMALSSFLITAAGAGSKHFWIEIKRSATTGFDQQVHYILYETEVDTVNGIGGFI